MMKVQRSTLIRSADRPEIEFKVACDVTTSDKLSDVVTSHATLNLISGRSGNRIKVLLWIFFSFFDSSFKWLYKKMGEYPIQFSG